MPKLAKSNSAPSRAITPIAKPSYVLPETKSTVSAELKDYSILLYGQEKIGKTDLCRRFGDPFFLMFEPGAKALSVYQAEIKTWEDLIGYLQALESSDRFKTIVWDTVDQAHEMCTTYVCEQEGMKHPSDEGYGKGHAKVNKEFTKWLNFSLKLGRGVILTSHAADREITSRLTGEKYNRIVPTMPAGARKVVEPMVDIWMYAHFAKDGQRFIRLQGNEDVAAGHRLQENFIGADVVPMGRDSKEAYANLLAAFNNEQVAKEPVKKTLKMKGAK